ncbi:MAG TPA: polysaccharide ABC transporter ATP-binding protein [Vicinamibacterales bacterium]|nr:polysaccharide ABC transporter ATP-binding protein [Vicinamibacterales bacterium]
MTEPVLSIEGLGKRYRLRHRADDAQYATLRDTIAGAVTKPFRWMKGSRKPAAGIDDFWALRDISCNVGAGEVVGIIGRNGAGKSTLLKILSRITEPTTGRVTVRGRVASLLEVGTGFHPELTGRENIFLNAAILGMTREEIRRNFDSIVSFAEIDRFLDTPVKRYSSGMYVRLAFAVAAHLEPEVLIVDEVLAVGDLEFQQKSLGKMQQVSRVGRTVLFVSHNMAAINALTTRTLLLDQGRVRFDGPTAAAIGTYSQLAVQSRSTSIAGRGEHTRILEVAIVDAAGSPLTQHAPGSALRLSIIVETDGSPRMSLEVFLLDSMHQKLAMASLHQFEGVTLPEQAGRYRLTMAMHLGWLSSGGYSLDVTTSIVNSSWDHYAEDAATIEVIASNPGGQSWDFRHDFGYGAFAMPCDGRPAFALLGDHE